VGTCALEVDLNRRIILHSGINWTHKLTHTDEVFSRWRDTPDLLTCSHRPLGFNPQSGTQNNLKYLEVKFHPVIHILNKYFHSNRHSEIMSSMDKTNFPCQTQLSNTLRRKIILKLCKNLTSFFLRIKQPSVCIHQDTVAKTDGL